jgi:hypothetical protein
MAKITVKPIDFESDTFLEMKSDLTEQLNGLINVMQSNGSEDGKLSMNITVHLEDDNDGTVPTIKHKIVTQTVTKSEKTGELDGNYIVEDDGNGRYVLKPLSEQLSMLEEYDPDDSDDEE